MLESVQAFQAPAGFASTSRSAAVSMFQEGDIGVLPPLGVYDPLGLIDKRDMRRYEIMEIKHGRGGQPHAHRNFFHRARRALDQPTARERRRSDRGSSDRGV